VADQRHRGARLDVLLGEVAAFRRHSVPDPAPGRRHAFDRDLQRAAVEARRLVAEEGGFLYNADSYADDLPYWDTSCGKPQLIVPYAFDSNDMRFATPQGFNSGDQFFAYLKDSFDVLYREGETRPRMMSVGLHCRLAGRPGRTAALERFLDYAIGHERVWITRRIDIARYWIATHPFAG
jgi:peptidoglycan/xylan/chitin deacetylase (PgdA/CDA1 family)